MIFSFPLDYMHLVLLGVFKRLIKIWCGTWNERIQTHTLSKAKLKKIDDRLKLIRSTYPGEFHRIPTGLNGGSLKATELRSILLYTGPVIFEGVLTPEQYQHFLYLHLGIRILVSEKKVIINKLER